MLYLSEIQKQHIFDEFKAELTSSEDLINFATAVAVIERVPFEKGKKIVKKILEGPKYSYFIDICSKHLQNSNKKHNLWTKPLLTI